MIKCIVFSKDRPLQLQAYLDSLLYYTNINRDCVFVLYKNEGNHYEILKEKYNGVNFFDEKHIDYTVWKEHTFNEVLKSTFFYDINCDEDAILFGCDDCVFIDHVNLDSAEKFLNENTDVLCVSLRLGLNIRDIAPPVVCEDIRFYKWYWPNSHSHWGYPFELMGTIYRASFVKEILNADHKPFRCPNDLESFGVMYAMKNCRYPFMSMFNHNNLLVAMDVNRCQDYFQNKYDGGSEHTIKHLKKLFKEGKVIDWINLNQISPPNVFVGRKYWRIINKDEIH